MALVLESSSSEAKAQLWNHALHFTKSMALKCAIELSIPETIHNNGESMTIPELASSLSIPPSKTLALSSLMKLLTSSGLFASTKTEQEHLEISYELTDISKLLISPYSPSPFILMILDVSMIEAAMNIGPWLRETTGTPFSMVHGMEFWELADVNPGFNDMFNRGMASDAALVKDVVVVEGRNYGLFDGVNSLVDVGGGTGTMAKAIKKEFPEMKCMVLELQHVVDTVTDDGGVEFIGGDMFSYVPPADVVVLKWILHDWSDEHCIKILQCCKEAIPTNKEGGKIIIIDMVVGVTPKDDDVHIPIETQVMFDMEMLILVPGKERTESEWSKLFNFVGFSSYKILPFIGVRSVIELYK